MRLGFWWDSCGAGCCERLSGVGLMYCVSEGKVDLLRYRRHLPDALGGEDGTVMVDFHMLGYRVLPSLDTALQEFLVPIGVKYSLELVRPLELPVLELVIPLKSSASSFSELTCLSIDYCPTHPGKNRLLLFHQEYRFV